jgi:hypothetical protein
MSNIKRRKMALESSRRKRFWRELEQQILDAFSEWMRDVAP